MRECSASKLVTVFKERLLFPTFLGLGFQVGPTPLSAVDLIG